MANVVGIARRYARALLAVAHEQKKTAQIEAQLGELSELFHANQDLQNVLHAPQITVEELIAIVTDLANKLNLEPALKNTLLVLAEGKRLGLLSDLSALYRELRGEQDKVVTAEILSAESLPQAYLDQVKDALERIIEKKVSLVCRQDPSVIAGVVARVGDQIFDGSAKGRLSEFKQTIIER